MKKKVKVKDILTPDELEKIHNLNKEIMKAITKTQIRYFEYEIDKIIEEAKKRYYTKKKAVTV